ncbi:hypothetical protein ACQP2F_21855 [Actinoplanes sp. CA-030573]|uniref:hypothetical protein n=1 Tax=Actinoplanes sp. CA-030573 TaxID=3239898 RepID=UPI003D94C550
MTTYALCRDRDGDPATMIAVWPTGVAPRAATVCRWPPELAPGRGADVCVALGRLSTRLWETYPGVLVLAERLRRMREALLAPNLPDRRGIQSVSLDPLVEAGHALGRLLHLLASPALTRVVLGEVDAETEALDRAGRGDLSGRAAQAAGLDHEDPSPVQVAAANRLLHETPLGDPHLFAAMDPPAACVAAAHWLAAAASVAADAAGCDPVTVFCRLDDLGPQAEVPATVVQAILVEGESPRRVVTHLIGEAMAAGRGLVPDPAGLPRLVDSARDWVAGLQPGHREQALAGLLERLTLLDPRRPSRSLLDHLAEGMRSCLLAYQEATEADLTTADGAVMVSAGVARRFVTEVRARAALDHDRLAR